MQLGVLHENEDKTICPRDQSQELQRSSSCTMLTYSNETMNIETKDEKTIDLRKLNSYQIKVMKPSRNLENPFSNMKISDSSFLNSLDGRSACLKCGKSRKYFCYTCYIPLPSIADKIPKLRLPCQIDIIKHPREIDGKSTAVHAAVIAPDDVNIYTFPNLPDYSLEENILLIFPDKDAIHLEDLWSHLDSQTTRRLKEPQAKRSKPLIPFKKAVFIDCTWNQTRRIYNDERIKGSPSMGLPKHSGNRLHPLDGTTGLQCVELTSRETLFWRYQRGKPLTYLATIEAIYYFLVDVHINVLKADYANEFDDLLFFFKFMFEKIHSLYDSDSLRAYKKI